MESRLSEQLHSRLAKSTAATRKQWAKQIIADGTPLFAYLSLLHGHTKTAQRFTWLIGDLCELDPEFVRPSLSIIFSLRHEMPFPGMRRCVARCLESTNVPTDSETETIPQLLEWLSDPDVDIGCKHYSARALFRLVQDGRVPRKTLVKALKTQTDGPTEAAAKRTRAMIQKLEAMNVV